MARKGMSFVNFRAICLSSGTDFYQETKPWIGTARSSASNDDRGPPFESSPALIHRWI